MILAYLLTILEKSRRELTKAKKMELELSEQERKSLMKGYEKQQKAHEKWLSTQSAAPKEVKEEKKQVPVPSSKPAASSGAQDDKLKAIQDQIEKIDAMSRE